MRLPDPLYQSVKHYMGGHQAWHFARVRPIWVEVDQRDELAAARAHFPTLKYLDEVGAGCEFLRFHREMVREFKWILINTAGHSFKVDEWKALPPWVEAGFPPGFVPGVMAEIRGLIARGSCDDLGSFLEQTKLATSPFADVHNRAHGIIGTYEIAKDPGGERLCDASMSDFGQTHHNEHFWSLHSWIDGFFADWQRRNGEKVDLTPKKPSHHHAMSFQPSDKLREAMRGTFFGKPIWGTRTGGSQTGQ